MSEILYNFAQNADSIQGHVSGVNEIESIREEIKQHFVTLAEVYGGQGAEALQVKHNSIDRLLSEAEDQARVMEQNAQDQQDAMQALDHANASQF